MNEYRHHVSGIFANRAEAQSAFENLIEKGLQSLQIQIFDTGSELPVATHQTKSNQVLKDMVVDGAIGTAVGTGISGLAGVALIATNVSLFVASPLLAPLVLLGWGASLGGLAGATVGSKVNSENKEGWFSDLIKDAITNGQAVLVAETRTKEETAIAREVIQVSVGNVKDVNLA